jgi:hypothetical protein
METPEPTRPSSTDDNRTKMTDSDIVAGLRSDNPKRRKAALEALCGGIHGGVLLVCTPRENRVSATNNLRPDTAFLGLMFIAQQVGKSLGLSLQWVPEQAPPQDGLVIASGGMVPPIQAPTRRST